MSPPCALFFNICSDFFEILGLKVSFETGSGLANRFLAVKAYLELGSANLEF